MGNNRRSSWSPHSGRHARRSRSSSYSDDDRTTFDPFTQRIREAQIHVILEKPGKMETCDGTSDPDEHIENMEAVLNYRNI